MTPDLSPLASPRGVQEGPLLDSVTMEVLHTAYLLRPRDEQTLAAALRNCPDDLAARLDALEAAGFARRVADGLEFESPYAVFVALGQARAQALLAENLRTVTLMDALPGLIRAWDLGTADPDGEHPLAVSIVHARSDSWAEWFRHAERERPCRPSLVTPEAEVLRVALDSGHLGRLQEQVAPSARVRVLVPADPTWGTGAELATLVAGARLAGVEFRCTEVVPSWLYVDAPSLVALPVHWGNGSPESALTIRTPPVVTAMELLFEHLWMRSQAWRTDEPPWVDVVRLLADGLTDDAVARVLGVTTRTVRRRIAEAMTELGVNSRFTLGMAWRARH
ncbi:helix-turn-helix transcriptional regulator [Nocardioides daejeonensis]|uniref:helix-turn-helix transcriptional regulator n=1 Tax=Nocardioides daejeonensis TaxID=1046556 RepID=UPI0013A55155|nr:helix-turn-helix transcriptional regulator [Nocardioides daejeonensis]